MSIKLLFTDMEGTIFAKQNIQLRPGEPFHHHSLWSRLMHELGPEALEEDARTVLKWEAGEYQSYLDWVDESIQIMKRHGLTREQFHRIMDGVPYNPGVKETFSEIHRRGIRTALISGGFAEQARKAQRELRINHSFAAAELFWEDGLIDHWVSLPSDYAGKVDFVKLLMREYRLKPEECAFIGDGENDAFIAREVGLSFAYQAHPELCAVSTYEIEDFSEMLQRLS